MRNGKLHIAMLGPLQVTVNGDTAVFRTDALRALLAYLATHQGTPQRRDTLAGLLSPDRPDVEALTYLRNRLTRLRQAVYDDDATPPWFEVDRKQIALRTGEDIVIDVMRFERLLAAVEMHPHRQLAGCPTCLAQLQEAVELVRGEFLAGLNFPSDIWESWVIAQREHYQQQTLEALTLLREARLIHSEWAAVLELAQRQLTIEPWLEAAHRALMQAYYHLGDRNAALAQYEQCAERLWDELGVEPETETQQLRAQIFSNGLIVADAAELPHNLPQQTGLFFGREAEQKLLLQRLVNPNYRLITLVGTGGVGKTRLALEVGQQVKTSFPDGVWFVPLDAVQGETEQIKIAVGEAVGLGQGDKQLTGEQVIAILRDKQLLFILDNCEVMLDELSFIPQWLKQAPHVVVLATSREPLNFQAEAVIMLEGLPIGAAEVSAAEALFAERGRMARAGFEITAANLPQVRQICELVDGSPLGISLAAAWVRRRSLAQIRDEIGRSLDFLSTRLRDVDPRHRSMRAVFETSWQLLTAEEQAVLAALSVFPTTFSAEAAGAVAGATLFNLDLLCEKSLLQQQHESERYVMHSLVRQFAADKLAGRTVDIERALADYFWRWARNHRDDYAALQPEWRNFAEGIAKARKLEAWQIVVDFVQLLDEPWFRQMRFSEMREGLKLALEAAEALQDEPTLAHMLLRLGEIEMELNEYASADSHLGEAIERLMRLEDSVGIAQAKYLVGRIKMEQTQDDVALNLFEESKGIFTEEDEPLGIAKNLNLIAMCTIKQQSDFKAGYELLEQSVLLQQQLPPSATYIEALRYLARVQGIMGEHEAAEQALIKATTASQTLQDVGEYAAVLFEHIVLCRRQNQIDAALQFAVECLAQFQKLGSLRWEALVKTQLGILHQTQHNYDQALSYFCDSLSLFVELGDVYEQAYAHCFLYQLYKMLGKSEQSFAHKQNAMWLNETLNDPEIDSRLE